MKSSDDSRIGRVNACNALIETIGSCGRAFFRSKSSDKFARFELEESGRLWFVDDYSQKRIYMNNTGHPWVGFSHGGTLRDLVATLSQHIRTGEPARLNLGPWPQWVCGGDLWGYGPEAMERVRRHARELGLAPVADASPEEALETHTEPAPSP
ncbi:hypothetical protein KBW71_00800 [Hydrogenophaga aromaticivorans]|uniref:hypothetical protein n=1 Tax=Hydrogenophaga aromaticivorans TaxID=2610898 RepID=UPI001B3937A4|nr:hypothetical protein [Hydrogenophaga aromaticivorans]MBQ0916990.1 hypothetical protein [Hydrogenophaga aromaticivorans]MBU4337820.1 hypothetical protein [Actinomycetota bacterium]